jgi:hypothetical protein
MKKILLLASLLIVTNIVKGQTCQELMEFVKNEGGYGTTYTSFNSTAISKVTFYEITVEYETHYFAIVCFKQSFSCNEYIYKVGARTRMNYSMNYISSAGKAFWDYIEPYNQYLGCAPNF